MIKKKFLILAPLFRKKETEKPKVVPEKPQETLPSTQKTEESVPKTVQKLLNQLLRKPLFQNLVFLLPPLRLLKEVTRTERGKEGK